MTSRDLGNVALKVLGIFALFSAISYLPMILSFRAFSSLPGYSGNVLFLVVAQSVGVLLYVGIGWWLLSRSERLSLKLFPASESTGFDLSSETLQAILFSVAGVLILVNAIPLVVGILIRTATIPNQGGFFLVFWRLNGESALVVACQVPLGVALVLGGRRLARLWHRMRPMSRNAEDGVRPRNRNNVD